MHFNDKIRPFPPYLILTAVFYGDHTYYVILLTQLSYYVLKQNIFSGNVLMSKKLKYRNP